MAAGSAAATGGREHQAQGDIPVAEWRPLLVDQFWTIAGMGLVTGATAASFAGIGNMQIMKVTFAITKFSIDARIRKTQQIFLVAGKAESIGTRSVWSIKRSRIIMIQQAKIIRAMWFMTSRTLAISKGTMEIFFILQFSPHIL